jgi:hypothetical protein
LLLATLDVPLPAGARDEKGTRMSIRTVERGRRLASVIAAVASVATAGLVTLTTVDASSVRAESKPGCYWSSSNGW